MSSIPVPNEGDVNIGAPLVTILWTLYAITTVIVVLRVYTQWRITKQLGWGDFLMSLSLICGIVFCISTSMGYRYGLGRHFFFLNSEQRILATKWNFIGQPLSMMAATFGRMAFTLLMIQIVGTTTRRRWLLWFLFWQGFVVNGGTIVLIFTQCRDARTLWDPANHPSFCIDSRVQADVGYAQCSLNALTDLVLTILPATIVWSLKMSVKLKIGVCFLLGLSVFALIAAVIKTIKLKSLGSRNDYTYNTVNFFIWVALECALVSIAASVPLIKPLVVRVKRTLTGSAPTENSYEMNRYNRSRGGKSARIESVEDGTGADNSSRENILTVADRRLSRQQGEIVMERSYVVTHDRRADV